MDQATRIREILKKRGIHGNVTKAQLLEALRALPPRPTYGAPSYADDSHDYSVGMLMFTPAQRQTLKLIPDVRLGRERVRPGIILRKELPHIVTKDMLCATRNAIGLEKLPGLAKPEAPTRLRSVTTFESVLRVRIHAIVCRNNDGNLSDGSPGQTQQEIGEAISNTIVEANKIFATLSSRLENNGN